jgi:hypothetical protein
MAPKKTNIETVTLFPLIFLPKHLNSYIVLVTNIKLKKLHRSRSGLRNYGSLLKNRIVNPQLWCQQLFCGSGSIVPIYIRSY